MWMHPRLSAKPFNGPRPGIRYAHEKRDGHRLTIFKQPTGVILAITRNGIAVDCRPWRWLDPIVLRMPPMSSVDGELVTPTETASDVPTALKKGDQDLQFITFAVPWYNGKDMSEAGLEWLEDVCTYSGLNLARWSPFENIDYVERARRLGIEGFVLKQANYKGWWKVKPVKTMEVIVMDYSPGRGKYLGLVGSIICGVWHRGQLVKMAAVSGMTDDQRLAFNLTKDIGRVLEIEYDKVAVRSLRFPRFKRWRDDKKIAHSHQDPKLYEVMG